MASVRAASPAKRSSGNRLSGRSLGPNVGALVAAILFGASVVAVRLAVEDIPPASLALLRFGQGAAFLLMALMLGAPHLLKVDVRDLPLLLLLGVILFSLFPLSFNAALRLTEASRGSVMLATMPVWSMWLARSLHREYLRPRQMAGVLITVVGIALAVIEQRPTVLAAGLVLLGDGLMLLTAFWGALYGVLAKRALSRYSPLTVTTYAMALGTLVLVPPALAELAGSSVDDISGTTLLLVIFLGLAGGGLAFFLWNAALSRLSPTRVAIYVNLNPLVATLLAILLLGERGSPTFIIGLVTVLIGVVLVHWSPGGQRLPLRT